MAAPQAIALNRFGLGARANDRVGDDPHGWVLDQLTHFEPVPVSLAGQLSQTELYGIIEDYRTASIARRKAGANAMMDTHTDPAFQKPPQTLNAILKARVTTACQSDTPFAERLVYFWSNHFAISADNLPMSLLAGNYEFEAIRPHVLGNFGDLLASATAHPAMLIYLNQENSIGPNSAIGLRGSRNGKQVGLNENLAREIMELHTLGARTGYSQNDVTEFARALTGRIVTGFDRGKGPKFASEPPGKSLFAEALHEPGPRTIMGKRYAEDGAGQAGAILADLAANPATARHIATKLARHFIADDPPAASVDRIAQAFLASGGDLPTIYRAVVDDPESWSESRWKFRSPWDWTIAATRATAGDDLANPGAVPAILQSLGQPIWRPGNPSGWGDTAADWGSPGALLLRVEQAQRIAARIGDRLDPRQLSKTVLADALSPATAAAVGQSEQSALGLALLLASPEFMRR